MKGLHGELGFLNWSFSGKFWSKNIVENGVFKGFMHDLSSANFFNVNPTGNGFKASVSGTVSVSPTNLYLQPGDKSFDELVGSVSKGILVTNENTFCSFICGWYSYLRNTCRSIHNLHY